MTARDRSRRPPPRDRRAAPAAETGCAAPPSRRLHQGAVPDILVKMMAVERDRPLQPFFEADGLPPAGEVHELRRVGVEAADIDRLLVRRPLDVLDPAGAGDADEQCREIAMADRPIAADVEDLAVAGVARAGAQKRVRGIVDVDEVADLRALAVDLDGAIFNREADEPGEES